MKPNLRRPVKIFWAVFFFITCACALLSLVLTLGEKPVNSTEIAVQAVVALFTAVVGGILIRRPRF